MHWSSEGTLAFLLTVMLVVGGFGGCAGYTVNGVPHGVVTNPADSSGLVLVALWAWNSIGFIVNMATFSVDGTPEWMGSIFLIMGALIIFIVVKLVRGNN